MQQIKSAENTFKFTNDELAVLRAILWSQKCDGDEMTRKAYKLTKNMSDKFQEMFIDSEIETWE